MVAVGTETRDGSVIFAKNTDRDPNEAHEVIHLSRKKHESDVVRTTYIEIPQVKESNEVLLMKPFWIWGAEMGTNNHGLTIGNEATWTKEPLEKESLIGMDFLRLALERAATASEALKIIVDLLEKYGQGGESGYDKSSKYHNSFILADPGEAWVLETAGRFWIAERVKGIRTISNCLTIENNYDKIHPGLIEHAIEKNYCKDEDDFNFKKNFETRFMPWAAKGDIRRACTLGLLAAHKGDLTPEHFMTTLRNHGAGVRDFNPAKLTISSKGPCWHASGITNPSQTTGSHVAHIGEKIQVHWITGTSAPCTSVFKPMILGNGTYPPLEAKEMYSDSSLWWEHEKIHRLIIRNYDKLIGEVKGEIEVLESQWFDEVRTLMNKSDEQGLFRRTKEILLRSLEIENQWFKLVKNRYDSMKKQKHRRYERYWRNLNKKVGLLF